MEPSETATFMKSVMDDNFMLIATVTFFICEAIFNLFPIEQARWKQFTSLIVGAILGLFILPGTSALDAMLQGLLAGGAATVVVAKFKKPKAVAVIDPVSSQATIPPSAIPGIRTEVPSEHPEAREGSIAHL